MRIAVNLRHFAAGAMGGGMEAYVRSTVGALDGLYAQRGTPIAILADPVQFAAIAGFAPQAELVAAPSDVLVLEPAAVAATGAELLFCPLTFLDPPDPAVASVPMVADLYPELEPLAVPADYRELARQWLRPSLRAADVVLTMATPTADQIAARHGIDRDRVVVAPPPVDPAPAEPDALDGFDLPERFLFYPARFYEHKNHRALVQALGIVTRRSRDAPQLVLTGEDRLPRELAAEIERQGLADRVHALGQVDREVVSALHERAAALAFVSRFEGFGIPPIEAMLAGTPVLASSHPVVREVVGDAALTVDESDPEAIAAGIERLLGDRGLADGLRAAGRERALRYDTAASLERHVAAFELALRLRRERPRVAYEPPTVGIVTPSLDSVDFVRATVESVLAQDYPRLRYVVMDGGSTDGTVDVLRSFGDDLDWISELDGGQSEAINRGIERVGGDIVAFLNSDDLYEPGAIATAVERFRKRPGAGMVHGRARMLDADGAEVRISDLVHVDHAGLAASNPIAQTAAFYAGGAWRDLGGLDTALHYALDYDLFIRIAAELPVCAVDDVLSRVRFHPAAKSEAQRGRCFRQTFAVARRHYGVVAPEQIDGYARWLVAGRPSIVEPVPRTRRSIALELPLGLGANSRHPLRAARAWARHAGLVSSYEGRWEDGWISRRWRSSLDVPATAERLEVIGAHHHSPKGKEMRVSVSLDGRRLADAELAALGPFTLAAAIPGELRGKSCELLIEASRTWSASPDPRRLSCQIETVAFD
jgi:glycosyltransferase involved in cell wall biosynthesis